MKRTPIRKRNPTRRKREWLRAYHSEAYVMFTQSRPCVVCAHVPSEAAHVTPRGELPAGMGRKADARWIVPLCHGHHTEMHRTGEETFQREHGRDLDLDAVAHWQRWSEL